ncbi:DNA repair and recombination protein RAD54B-like [Clytia hemisphaerica]|uniref:DNA repair and recombination protein RAD54B-like n=1 Tax=Clytia hemisphaerica TaxID=252671 RepID=UPI0034D4486D
MRKSSAPSLQGQSAKKRKFCTPFNGNSTQKEQSCSSGTKFQTPFKVKTVAKETLHGEERYDTAGRNVKNAIVGNTLPEEKPANKLTVQSSKTSNEKDVAVERFSSTLTVKPSKTFVKPSNSRSNLGKTKSLHKTESTFNQQESSSNSSTTQTENTNCFEVLWCKCSSKKNKVWEGDGVLVVKNNKLATLYDTQGNQICKSSGCKSSDLAALEDGSLIKFSGKEVEIQNSISPEDYQNGNCFTSAAQNDDLKENTHSSPSSAAKTKAITPFKPIKSDVKSNHKKTSLKPRHNPNAEGALVMPEPHQQGTVPVVVDPYIALCLRPHQRQGVTFLYECVMDMRSEDCESPTYGAILADEMGLGKTIQCISLIWTLLKQGIYGRPTVKNVIVVTPNSLAKNWSKEFCKWLGSERLNPFVVSSTNRVDEFLLRPNNQVMIISYEMVTRCIEDIRKVAFDLLVCDEAHRLKNTNVKITSIISGLQIPKCILLTGTPIQNNLEEFHTLADLACPGVFGTISAFRRNFIEPITRAQQPGCTADDKQLSETCLQNLTEIMNRFCLRRTSEVNQKHLPPKVEYVVFVRMSSLQRTLYNSLIQSTLYTDCMSNQESGSKHLLCIGALKKLCNSPHILRQFVENKTDCKNQIFEDLLDHLPEDDDIEDCCKLQVVHSLISSFRTNKEKVLLVALSTKVLDILAKFCDSIEIKYVRLDGKMTADQRQSSIDRFNDKSSNIMVFLLSSKAGGVGLNLTAASRLILYDIDWNPANDLQAMARIWRDGQKKKVHIYRLLVNGSIEEKIYQRQIIKNNLSGTIVDSLANNKVCFSTEQLKDLFKLRESESCHTHDLLQCQCFKANQSSMQTSKVTFYFASIRT